MKQKSSILVFGLVVIVIIALSSCLPPPDLSDPQNPEPASIEPGTGLLGSYFDSTSGQRILVRNDSQLNFYWSTGNSPHASVPHDYFSIVWEGQIRAPENQKYILSVRVDDGVRVFIDNQLLIESWQNQGGSEGQEPLYHSNLIELSSIELKNIRIEYYEANWTAAIRLYWRKEGESENSMTLIPTEYLYPATDAASQMPQGAVAAPSEPTVPITQGTGLRGTYFNSTTSIMATTRIDSLINFDWGESSAVSNLPNDYFSSVWEGTLRAPITGTYTFIITVDDGARLFLNGDNIFSTNAWNNQPATTYTGTYNMNKDVQYPIRIEYYEAWGQALIQLNWTRPDGTTQIIPTEYLYPATDAASQMPQGAVAAPSDTPIENPIDEPSDSEYGARDVPRSKTPSSSDVYVSPLGTGTTCSLTNPCSINEGLKKNGFIWLLDGTYDYEGQLSLNDGKTLEAYNPKKAIIDFRNTPGSRMTLGHNNIVRNIVVRNAAQTGIMVFGNNNLLEGIISEYNFGSGFQTWPGGWTTYGDTKNPDGGNYNDFIDNIARYNNDCTKETCSDSGADGISVSAGRGNRIIRFTAYANSDDGIDIWASYETLVQNSNSYDNGFDSVENQIGNGMQYKMGCNVDYASYCPVPNNNKIINNWAHGKHIGLFSRNGGEGFAEITGNVCYDNKESC